MALPERDPLPHPPTNASTVEILRWAAERFVGKIALANSLGLEDQILTHLITVEHLPIPIFTLDTGRLFPETLELIATTEARYGLRIEVFVPEREALERLLRQQGMGGFRSSVEARKHCCAVRKLEPLRRALAGKTAWICGLRQEQSPTRTRVEVVEEDGANGLIKINPLARWSLEDVEQFIQAEEVPVSPLHAKGFPSIGCACCTRAIQPGEDQRAGRWWWESPEKKECGLHRGAGAGGQGSVSSPT